MANLDPFTAQIVEYVRSMPDEALLELVRAHFGNDVSVQLPSGGGERARAKPRQVAPAKPRATKPRKGTTSKQAKPAKRAPSMQREQLLDTVEKLVKSSHGLSSSEVAKKAKVPQTRVTAALRELKSEKRVFQGGERRFARYAGDVKTAQQASTRARKTASGPKRG